jgi:hypothetical protein
VGTRSSGPLAGSQQAFSRGGSVWERRAGKLAIRVPAKADVARSGPTSPKGLADLKQGSTIQLSGKSRPWGIKAQKVLI